MFAPKKNTYVDNEISRVVIALQEKEPTSEEYSALLEKLSKLQKIRQEEKPDTVSSNTIAMGAVNLTGILLILQHENLHVISSKALSFVSKLK